MVARTASMTIAFCRSGGTKTCVLPRLSLKDSSASCNLISSDGTYYTFHPHVLGYAIIECLLAVPRSRLCLRNVICDRLDEPKRL